MFDVLDERIKDNQEMLKEVPPNERKELMKYISITRKGIKKPDTYGSILRQICSICSIVSVTMHGLRHMCGILMLESGAAVSEVSKFLGHKNELVTFEVYLGILGADVETRTIIDRMDPVSEVKYAKNH